MKKVELKSNEILQNYINELNNDVQLNEYNLKEKSLLCSSIWAKWISYLFLEKENMQRILDAKAKIIKQKTSTSKINDSVLRMKSEEKILENDETLQKLNIMYKNTQDCIDYIERSLNLLSNFGFAIKNTTEVFKLQFSR